MIHYSVVIPQRDRGDEFRRQLPQLVAMLDRLTRPYEILCVDDGSAQLTLQLLEQLLPGQPAMRLLVLDAPAGVSTALSVGIAAARGNIVVALELGKRHAIEQIPHLISRLSRLDLVYIRRRLNGWRKFWHRVGRIPRAMLLGLEVRHPERLFWAARREAVAGIHLSPGMRRYLPWLVARRGFRVGDMYIAETTPGEAIADVAVPDGRRNPLDLLTAWWLCRRWHNDSFHEVHVQDVATLPAEQSYRAISA
jgi:glycosyltransferase involved in cell wall biosynthesis